MEVTGFIKKSINQPNKKDVIAKMKNILKFEYPKIFSVSKFLLFLI